jgi:hypothetical protein
LRPHALARPHSLLRSHVPAPSFLLSLPQFNDAQAQGASAQTLPAGYFSGSLTDAQMQCVTNCQNAQQQAQAQQQAFGAPPAACALGLRCARALAHGLRPFFAAPPRAIRCGDARR